MTEEELIQFLKKNLTAEVQCGKEVNVQIKKPKPAEPKEDKHFDNILKDSFRDHNRLHIAAMMVPSVMATVPCSENEKGHAILRQRGGLCLFRRDYL